MIERCGERLADAGRLADTVHAELARQALWRASRAYDRGRTGQVAVDELVEFAASCWPQYRRLAEYRGLALRRRIGPTAMPYLQTLVLSAVVHKGREWLWWKSWKRRGI